MISTTGRGGPIWDSYGGTEDANEIPLGELVNGHHLLVEGTVPNHPNHGLLRSQVTNAASRMGRDSAIKFGF